MKKYDIIFWIAILIGLFLCVLIIRHLVTPKDIDILGGGQLDFGNQKYKDKMSDIITKQENWLDDRNKNPKLDPNEWEDLVRVYDKLVEKQGIVEIKDFSVGGGYKQYEDSIFDRLNEIIKKQ